MLTFERAIRGRALDLHGKYVEGEARRRWASNVLGREAAERGFESALDRMEAETIAGGPPSDLELAPLRAAAAEAIPLGAFVEVMRERFAWIAEGVGA